VFVTVAVGIDVTVAVGRMGVAVWVSVGADVKVGNAVGGGSVGKGVNVGKSKSNKAVGVATVPLGKMIGLGVILEALRDGNKGIRREQRQQNTDKNKTGKSILPSCPCWL
jgi:hypothetical protein